MRRTMILLGLLTSLLVLALASPAFALTLKIASAAPEGSSWMKDMRAGAKEVKERTQGRVQIKLYGGGVMGNYKSVLRKIRVGQLNGAAFTGGSLADIYPDMRLLSLPFVFHGFEDARKVRKIIDPILLKGLRDKGFISFGFAGGGFAYIMSNAPVRTSGDLKGRKVWAPEGDVISYAVLEAMGLSPVTLPLIDVMTGLQTGLLDIVAAPPTGALAFQWHTKVRYITEAPLAYIFATLVVDKRTYNKISPEDQKVLDEVMGGIYKRFDAQGETDTSNAISTLKQQGIEFVAAEKADLDAWRKTSVDVERRLGKKGLFSPKLYEKMIQITGAGSSGQ